MHFGWSDRIEYRDSERQKDLSSEIHHLSCINLVDPGNMINFNAFQFVKLHDNTKNKYIFGKILKGNAKFLNLRTYRQTIIEQKRGDLLFKIQLKPYKNPVFGPYRDPQL